MKKIIKAISAFVLSTIILLSANIPSFAAVSFDNESGNPIKFTVYAICRLGSSAEQDAFSIQNLYYYDKADLDLYDYYDVNYKNAMYNGKEVTTIYGKSEKAYVIYMFSFAGPTGYYFFDDNDYYKEYGVLSPYVYHYSSTGFETYEYYQWTTDYLTRNMIQDNYPYQRTYLPEKNQKLRLYTFANYITDDEFLDVYDAYTEWALANEEQINPAEFNIGSEPTEPVAEVEKEPVVEEVEPMPEPEMVIVTPTEEIQAVTPVESAPVEKTTTPWWVWVFGVAFIGVCAFVIIKTKKQ